MSGGWGVVQRELQTIWDTRGRLEPADVVEVARNPKNPLHKRFTWDDTEAARLHRLNEASALIRSVHITVRTVHGSGRVRAFVSPRGASDDRYLPVKEAGANRELSALVLQQMRRDIENLVRKYAHLAEFWDMADELVMLRKVPQT